MEKFYLKSKLKNGITVDSQIDYDFESRKLYLKAGSIINGLDFESNVSESTLQKRKAIRADKIIALKKGKLIENTEDGSLKVIEDITFKLPTTAAEFVVGKQIQGGEKIKSVETGECFDMTIYKLRRLNDKRRNKRSV